jgi:DNA-binding transcriptional MocR family regulator
MSVRIPVAERRKPSADPETLADTIARVVDILRDEGRVHVRGLFRKVYGVRRTYVMLALQSLEMNGQATWTPGNHGKHLWSLVGDPGHDERDTEPSRSDPQDEGSE